MNVKVFCKTERKGMQTFYADINGNQYRLFEQEYRVSNRDYFHQGIYFFDKKDYSKLNSYSVKRTLDKINSYLKYIQSEYHIKIFNNDNGRISKKLKTYKIKERSNNNELYA